jgi:hypothetical protein
MEGSGQMLVTAVGVHSQAGIIMQLLCAERAVVDTTKKTEKKVLLEGRCVGCENANHD